EQADARFDAEVPGVAIGIDALPVDVLEHEIGLARGRQARIDQTRDVRVAEPGEDAALALEALLARLPDQAGVEQLDGHQPLVAVHLQRAVEIGTHDLPALPAQGLHVTLTSRSVPWR